MPQDPVKNHVYSTVTTAPSPGSSGTSITLTDATLFPDPATAGQYNVVIWPASASPTHVNAEIVRVTAKAVNILTIVRTQEGSLNRTVISGDQVMLSLTSKIIDDLRTNIADNEEASILFTGHNGNGSQVRTIANAQMTNSWLNYSAPGRGGSAIFGWLGFHERFDGTIRVGGLIHVGTAGGGTPVITIGEMRSCHDMAVPAHTSGGLARVSITSGGALYTATYTSWISAANLEYPTNMNQVWLVGAGTAPAYQNSWASYNSVGSTWQGAGFYKDAMGFVHITGMIRAGTANSVIFTLPVGYRPSKLMIFPAIRNNGSAEVYGDIKIYPNGDVEQGNGGGTNIWMSLCGVCFTCADSPLENDWQPLALLNSWVDANAAVAHSPEYLIAPDGYVYFRGRISSGTTTSGTNIAALPVIPAERQIITVHSNGNGAVDTAPNGYLITRLVSSSNIFLNAVRYKYSNWD